MTSRRAFADAAAHPFLTRLVVGLLSFWGVLLAFGLAVLLALGWSGLSAFGGLPASAALDYRTHEGVVSPLSDEYLSELLGRPLPGLGVSPALLASPSAPAEDRATRRPEAGASGSVDHAATNDDVDDAIVIAALPFAGRTRPAGAGRQPGEPTDCSGSGPTLWYRYAATTEQLLQASAIGSSGGAAIGVFTRRGPSFQTVSCDSSIAGGARTVFRPQPGTEYWFQVTPQGGPRQVVFSLEPVGTTERVSRATDGGDPNSVSSHADISADGRYIAFESWATNLVPGDTNDQLDVFVADRLTGRTERVSVSSQGAEANGNSGGGSTSISSTGRYVAFVSHATNLVPDDSNQSSDVFVHDRATGRTERVSVATDGAQGRWPSDISTSLVGEVGCRIVGDEAPTSKAEDNELTRETCSNVSTTSISDDGRFVAFDSWLDGLSIDDHGREQTGGATRDESGNQVLSVNFDVFVHDRERHVTTLVSVPPDAQSNGPSRWPELSGDGAHVAFSSSASNLVAKDTNNLSDVFVRDLRTGQIARASVSTTGVQADGNSEESSLSRDGRYLAFESTATNLSDERIPDSTQYHLYVRDLVVGETSLAGVSSAGADGEFGSGAPSISADGRFIAFTSPSQSFGDSDADEFWHTYIHDRVRRTTSRVSISSTGESGDQSSYRARISADARHIAFDSYATNFDDRDRNARLPDRRQSLYAGLDIYVHTIGH